MTVELRITAAICVGVIACAFDLSTRRIPNVLTFGASLVALTLCLVTEGLPGLGSSAAGWLIGCALFLPLFLLRGLGAGDVKLLAALGAWVGPSTIVWTALYGAIAGGVMAVALSFGHGYLRQAVSNVGYLLWYWRTTGPGPVPEFTLADAKGPRLAYAAPIVVGLVAALWLH